MSLVTFRKWFISVQYGNKLSLIMVLVLFLLGYNGGDWLGLEVMRHFYFCGPLFERSTIGQVDVWVLCIVELPCNVPSLKGVSFFSVRFQFYKDSFQNVKLGPAVWDSKFLWRRL